MSWAARLGLAAALGVMLAAGACSRPARPVADPWIAEVATVNRRADRLLDADDAAGARALLRTLVTAQKSGALLDEDRRLALEDCYFRLARLALGADDPVQALADADSGLAYQTAPSLFVANLLVARGAAHEALNEPRAAAEDYHRGLLMNEALLRQAMRKP
ncbi:MAG TPA: hypothetical protein VKZ18_18035 [Polyangia bacterium]|nr:hypothetical protein [Polyangia bacterium]